ncbi:MAG: tetratricopeptide repeat protein, partial [Gemmatimonadaceae bacterium]
MRPSRWATLLTVLLMSTASAAQPGTHHGGGAVDFPISCSAPAQREFNRGVALLHNMTYVQARETFERVAAMEPGCAMAHWGIAMTLFQPLWPSRPQPPALERGWAEAQRADSLGPPTPREQSFVASVAAFFAEPSSSDYWRRIARWEAAEHETFIANPDDPDAAAFYALALLASAPSTASPRVNADSAAAILLRVYARHPNHPGAMHYLIHADDMPGREHEALDITAKYPAIAPNNAHALHMPTHIYTRLGDWDKVIRGNIRSKAAALTQPAGDHGELISDEYPHAVEYLVYAYLQEGADDEAAQQTRRLRSTAHLEPTFKTAFHLASCQARYALERRAWDEAARIVPRQPASVEWDRYAWPEAISQFARGLGEAHLGALDSARAAGARLEQLEQASGRSGEELFTRNIRMLRLELDAWIAHAGHDDDSSTAWLQEAAALEVSTPKPAVTPAPTLPAHELLGDLFMAQQRPADALAAYRRSLELYPRRFNSLLGAARAARALGDTTAAIASYRQLLDVGRRGTRRHELREARTYASLR